VSNLLPLAKEYGGMQTDQAQREYAPKELFIAIVSPYWAYTRPRAIALCGSPKGEPMQPPKTIGIIINPKPEGFPGHAEIARLAASRFPGQTFSPAQARQARPLSTMIPAWSFCDCGAAWSSTDDDAGVCPDFQAG